MADKPNLANLDATEWLTLYSDDYLKLMGGSLTPDTPGGASAVTLAVKPRNKALPGANISLASGGGQSPTATVFLGGKLFNYEGRFEGMSQKQGGPAVTNTVSGKAGPVAAHYSEMEQPGNQGLRKTVAGANLNIGPVGAHFSRTDQRDSRETGFGANLNIGPVQLSALRNLLSRDAVDPRLASDFLNRRHDTQTDIFRASGSLPVGPGTLSGDISRQFVKEQGPQRVGQDTRPTGKHHVTKYGLGWKSDEGKVGPGILNVRGDLTDPRGGKSQSTAGASYSINRPFGLPASVVADISSVNPLDPKRRRYEAWLRLTRPF